MFVVACEHIYDNPELNEIKDVIGNTLLKNKRKNGDNCYSKIKITYNFHFFDKTENKTNYITTNHGPRKNNNSISRKISIY